MTNPSELYNKDCPDFETCKRGQEGRCVENWAICSSYVERHVNKIKTTGRNYQIGREKEKPDFNDERAEKIFKISSRGGLQL